MDIEEKILGKMRNPEVYWDVLKYVEENISDAFNICCRKNLSINEKWSDNVYKRQLNQKTVFITVRMFDLWETAIIEVLKEKFKEDRDISILPKNDPIGDLIVNYKGKELMRWEIKTTQGNHSFTGATHSSSKCNNYILINYSIDKDKKLNYENNKGFITSIAVLVWDSLNQSWIGKPTEKSSFTTLKIPIEVVDKRKEIVVIGRLKKKKKWCAIERQSTNSYF